MRGYANHGARHHPKNGSDPVLGIPPIDIAYYEITGVDSGTFPGVVKYALSLTSTSDSVIFDLATGSARINQDGVYTAYAFIDHGAAETIAPGGGNVYRFGLTFSAFPFYTVGGPWTTQAVPSDNLLIYDTEVTGKFVMEAADAGLEIQLFETADSMSPGGALTGYLVLERVRDFDWTF